MSAPFLKRVDWVHAKGPGFTIECQRCGRSDTFATPIPVRALPWLTRAFQEIHRYCKEKKA